MRPAAARSNVAANRRSHPIQPRAAASLALLLAACAAGDCLPPAEAPERAEFRARLHPLVARVQCPGGPTLTHLRAQESEHSRRKEVLIERVRRSRLAEDLARVKREDEEMNRNLTAAECDLRFWNTPADPENVARSRARLRAERQALEAAEAAFARVVAACATE